MSRSRWISLSSILVTLFLAPAVWPVEAAGLAQDAAQQAAGSVPTAPVRVDGNVLFSVRGVSALPAEERAALIVANILAAARDPSIPADSVKVLPSEMGVQLVAGSLPLFQILEADAEMEGVRVDQLATVIQARVRTAISEHRADRAPGVLFRNGLVALAGLAMLFASVWVLGFAARLSSRWFEVPIRRQLETLQARTAHVVQVEGVWRMLGGLMSAARTLVTLVLIYLYLQASLELFPWTRQFGRDLLGLVSDPLRIMATSVVEQIPSVVFLVLLVVVARWTLKLIGLLFKALERGTIVLSGFDAEWAVPTYKIVRIVLIAFAVVVAFPYIPGSGTGAFRGVSLFLGLLVSIGSSSMLVNIIAGYTMTYRRAFRLGDRIRVNDLFGVVSEVRLMVTTLRSPKNEQIVVPNSIILNSPVINYSVLARNGGLILHTDVGIGYETPWRQVEAMLLLAAERTPGLSRTPPPFVQQKALGDFCVVYELNAYCPDAAEMLILQTAMHREILDVFNEYGVQIMTPAYERDPDVPKVVPRDQWHAAPATVGSSAPVG